MKKIILILVSFFLIISSSYSQYEGSLEDFKKDMIRLYKEEKERIDNMHNDIREWIAQKDKNTKLQIYKRLINNANYYIEKINNSEEVAQKDKTLLSLEYIIVKSNQIVDIIEKEEDISSALWSNHVGDFEINVVKNDIRESYETDEIPLWEFKISSQEKFITFDEIVLSIEWSALSSPSIVYIKNEKWDIVAKWITEGIKQDINFDIKFYSPENHDSQKWLNTQNILLSPWYYYIEWDLNSIQENTIKIFLSFFQSKNFNSQNNLKNIYLSQINLYKKNTNVSIKAIPTENTYTSVSDDITLWTFSISSENSDFTEIRDMTFKITSTKNINFFINKLYLKYSSWVSHEIKPVAKNNSSISFDKYFSLENILLQNGKYTLYAHIKTSDNNINSSLDKINLKSWYIPSNDWIIGNLWTITIKNKDQYKPTLSVKCYNDSNGSIIINKSQKLYINEWETLSYHCDIIWTDQDGDPIEMVINDNKYFYDEGKWQESIYGNVKNTTKIAVDAKVHNIWWTNEITDFWLFYVYVNPINKPPTWTISCLVDWSIIEAWKIIEIWQWEYKDIDCYFDANDWDWDEIELTLFSEKESFNGKWSLQTTTRVYSWKSEFIIIWYILEKKTNKTIEIRQSFPIKEIIKTNFPPSLTLFCSYKWVSVIDWWTITIKENDTNPIKCTGTAEDYWDVIDMYMLSIWWWDILDDFLSDLFLIEEERKQANWSWVISLTIDIWVRETSKNITFEATDDKWASTRIEHKINIKY